MRPLRSILRHVIVAALRPFMRIYLYRSTNSCMKPPIPPKPPTTSSALFPPSLLFDHPDPTQRPSREQGKRMAPWRQHPTLHLQYAYPPVPACIASLKVFLSCHRYEDIIEHFTLLDSYSVPCFAVTMLRDYCHQLKQRPSSLLTWSMNRAVEKYTNEVPHKEAVQGPL